jgi:spore germination cell wall hydrolase CwlJ-like protein
LPHSELSGTTVRPLATNTQTKMWKNTKKKTKDATTITFLFASRPINYYRNYGTDVLRGKHEYKKRIAKTTTTTTTTENGNKRLHSTMVHPTFVAASNLNKTSSKNRELKISVSLISFV